MGGKDAIYNCAIDMGTMRVYTGGDSHLEWNFAAHLLRF